MRWEKRIRAYWEEILRVKTTPHEIALGFAVGTFIEILPLFVINVIVALAVSLLYKRISKIALFFALLFWNPLFTIPLYALSYRIGSFLFRGVPLTAFNVYLLDRAYEFTMRFLVGNIIVAAALALAGYVVVWLAAQAFQKIRHEN